MGSEKLKEICQCETMLFMIAGSLESAANELDCSGVRDAEKISNYLRRVRVQLEVYQKSLDEDAVSILAGAKRPSGTVRLDGALIRECIHKDDERWSCAWCCPEFPGGLCAESGSEGDAT